MKEQQKKNPRHLSLKKGDKVVVCPHKSNTHERGVAGIILEVLNHLSVVVEYEMIGRKQPVRSSAQMPTYNLRHASECHRCVHRITHLSGGMCPQSWKEVKFADEMETSNE